MGIELWLMLALVIVVFCGALLLVRRQQDAHWRKKFNGADWRKFDRDNDGRPGGSRKK